MSTCTCYDTYIAVKQYLILPEIWLHYQFWIHVILHEVATINKNNTSPIDEWLFRVASLHIIRHDRFVMLPEVTGRVCVCMYLHQAQTPEKNNKRPLQYARWLTTLETSSVISYTCLNPFITVGIKCRNRHSDAVGWDYIKETGISCQHLAVRHSNGAKPEEAFVLWRHDNTAKRAVFVSGDVRFQDGDAVDLGKMGGGPFLLSSFSIFQCM